MAKFTDFHVHLLDEAFHDDLPEVLARARDVGVNRFVCNGTHPDDWQSILDLARNTTNIIPCLGLHPWFLAKFTQTTEIEQALAGLKNLTLRDLHKINKNPENKYLVPGIGEIGLDRAIRQRDDTLQEYAFEWQLDLALDLRLPVMLHTVRSVTEVLKKLRKKPLFYLFCMVLLVETLKLTLWQNWGDIFRFLPRFCKIRIDVFSQPFPSCLWTEFSSKVTLQPFRRKMMKFYVDCHILYVDCQTESRVTNPVCFP